MSDQAEPVLAGTLERLVGQGTITRGQADAVRSNFHLDFRAHQGRSERAGEPNSNSWSAILAEVGGYVGAAFVVAAAVALVGPSWDNFSQSVRIAVLAGPAVLLLIAAVVVAAGMPGKWTFRPTTGEFAPAAIRRLVGALVLAGGGLLGAATAVIIEDSGSERWVPLVPLLVWGVGYLLCRGVPLQVGTAVALTWAVLMILDENRTDQFPLSGLVLVLAGIGWAALAKIRLIEEQALAIVIAGVLAFTGGEIVATSEYTGLGYLLLGLLAVAGLGGYVLTHQLSALGVGATTLAVVVPQVVIDYTEGSLGAAGGLLVSGLSVVAVSVLAARLRRSSAAGPTSGPTSGPVSGPTEVV
jgi:hypothetical protein